MEVRFKPLKPYYREDIFLQNIIHAQKAIDNLPLKVEKNILYDIGGELQSILEKHYMYKTEKENKLYDNWDTMLRMIIDRVKEIEEGSVGGTSIFNSTTNRYTWTYSNMDNTKSFQRKLVFESNIKKYIDESQTPTDNNASSFVVRIVSGNSRGKRVETGSSMKGGGRLKRNEVIQMDNLFTPATESLDSGTILSWEMDYQKWYKGKMAGFKVFDKDATTKGRDISPKAELQTLTNETISLFGNKVSSNKKGKGSSLNI